MKVIGKIIKGLLVVAFLMIVCVSGIFYLQRLQHVQKCGRGNEYRG